MQKQEIDLFPIHIKPFDLSTESEILEFAVSHPWKPHWSQQQIREFIQRLSSSHDLVFDLHSNGRRIACAALIDNIQNKGNNACLELLGVDQTYDLKKIYSSIIQRSKAVLPKTRSGIEITVHNSLTAVENLLLHNGFVQYYETFEMISNTNILLNGEFNQVFSITEQDYAECYKVIFESCRDNPDICIPTYEDWKMTRKSSNESQIWVYKEGSTIYGFINLTFNLQMDFGEIRTVGVLPEHRGRGIGKKLIEFSLMHLAQNNIKLCHLTVATKNKNALQLYQNLGFSVVNHFEIYCWNRNL